MVNYPLRLTVFIAVALALLNAGFHFHRGDAFATMYFMVGAILLTAVTNLGVRRRAI